MQHQYLAIALGPGADADGRDVQSGGDALRYLGGDAFQDHGKGARRFQGERVFHQVMDGRDRFALNPVSAHAVDGLRGKPKVPHDRDLRVREPFHQVETARSAFDFHCLGAGFLEEARCVGDPFRRAHLVGAEGHIGDHHRVLDRAAYGAGVKQHLVHGDGEGVFIAHDHHGKRIPNQDEVDPGFVHQPRSGVVVGSQGHDGGAVGFLVLKCLDGHPGAGAGADGSAVRKCVRLMVNSSATPRQGCCPISTVDQYTVKPLGEGSTVCP